MKISTFPLSNTEFKKLWFFEELSYRRKKNRWLKTYFISQSTYQGFSNLMSNFMNFEARSLAYLSWILIVRSLLEVCIVDSLFWSTYWTTLFIKVFNTKKVILQKKLFRLKVKTLKFQIPTVSLKNSF